MSITETAIIPAPIDRVWEVMTDVTNLPTVLSGMTKLVVEGDPTFKPGLAWTQTRVIKGRTGSERLTVAHVDNQPDPKTFETQGGSHGFDYRTTYTLTSVDGGTRVDYTFAGEPSTAFGRVMMKLFGKMGLEASRAAMVQDLADIAEAC